LTDDVSENVAEDIVCVSRGDVICNEIRYHPAEYEDKDMTFMFTLAALMDNPFSLKPTVTMERI